MKIETGDIVLLRQEGEGEPEFLRARVVDVLPGINNDDWKGFYYVPVDDEGRDLGCRLFAYDYSVARVEAAASD